jgi:hypothetical protein
MSFPWIKVNNDLPDHHKSDALASALNEPRAWTYLVELWLWASRMKPDGNLAGLADLIIAKRAGWTGDADAFVAALIETGWMTPERTLHDWEEHQGAIRDKAYRDRERSEERRATTRATAGPATGRATGPATGRATNEGPATGRATGPATGRGREERRGEEKRGEEKEEGDAAAPQDPTPETVPDDTVSPPPTKALALAAPQPLTARPASIAPSAAGASGPPAATAPTPQVLPPTHRPPQLMRMRGSLLDQDLRAAEPKTPAEFLARAYDYPHQVAQPGQKTFGDALMADPNVAKAFDGKDGRWDLERALVGTAWGHWQSQDEMGRDRWPWPTKAPAAIEKWVKDEARKVALDLDRQRATRKGAEARGIDLEKPDEKVDPTRSALAKVWIARSGRGEDMPPMAVWVDEVIEHGRVDEVLATFRRAAPAAAAGDASVVRNDVGARDAAAKAAFDAYCASIPPQHRAQHGVPTWTQWVDLGRPARFTGQRLSGGPSPSPPPSSSANRAPPEPENAAPFDVDPAEVAKAKAALAALAAGFSAKAKPKRPLQPDGKTLTTMLERELGEGADT